MDAAATDDWTSAGTLAARLHVYVAFDWGEEVDLDLARQLVPSELHALARRPRTPSSIAYRPPPLRAALAPVALQLAELGDTQAAAEATVFDFAAVSVALHVPLEISPAGLRRLAATLAEPEPLVSAARAAVQPLYQRLLPAIVRPVWSELGEEYFVFEFDPKVLPPLEQLLTQHADWLAGLVRLEAEPLASQEVCEALRFQLRYYAFDLFVPDWAAAVLIDRDCEETLQVIEFANLQLLEFREIDGRLDTRLSTAYNLIHTLARRWLPLWRAHTRQLRALGELKVEANTMFDRASNALKLVGDQYLARVYRLIGERFHLSQWEQSIRQSLDVVEGVYRVVSDQAASYRTEVLELTIVLLILADILLALWQKL